MASRAILHINKLKKLEKWLEKQGYMILPTSKNPYEVLRAKKDKNTVIIYQKSNTKEHLSVMEKDYDLIRKFIEESKKKTNADRIRNMSDEELADILFDSCVEHIGTDRCVSAIREFTVRDNCIKCILEWLRSEAE